MGLASASLLHELRQPVFAIKAFAQLGRVEGEVGAQERLAQILAQIEHLEALLELYGATGAHPGVQVDFDLGAEARAALALLAARVERLGVSLQVELPEEGMLVRGRPLAARQVVVNLLQNALDAVTRAPTRRVAIGGRCEDGVVRLWVEDSGEGLDPDVAERLFEPFESTREDGLGLGLFIARCVVEEAEGALQIEPADAGARFVLSWPAAH